MEQNERVVVIPHPKNTMFLAKHRAFYVKGGKYLYCLKENDDLQIPGLRNVYADSYLYDLLVQEAFRQLERYLEENLHNMEMYQFDDFWEGALRYAGRLILPGTIYTTTQQVEQGIVTIYYHIQNNYSDFPLTCCYDFVSERLFLKYADWHRADEEAPQDFMRYFYRGGERYILAQQQFDAGLIPAPYMGAYFELCSINSFLEGKRTVRVHFQNGKAVPCYPRQVQTAAFLIKLKDAEFIPFTYNYRPDEKETLVHLSVEDGLPCKLTHYSQKLDIDTEAFVGLNLTPTDPKALARREYEAKKAETARLIIEGGCFTFCQVRLSCGDYPVGQLLLPGSLSTRDALLQKEPVRSALLRGFTKFRKDCRAQVTQYRVGSGPTEPIPDTLLETIQKLSFSDRPLLPGYTESEQDPVLFDFGFLFDTFNESSELPLHERRELLLEKLRRSAPEGVSYLFGIAEICGVHRCELALVSGHPWGDEEVLSLKCVQGFIRDNPDDSGLTVYIHCYYIGCGQNVILPDHLMKLMGELDLEEMMYRNVFNQSGAQADEYNFTLKEEEQIDSVDDYFAGMEPD